MSRSPTKTQSNSRTPHNRGRSMQSAGATDRSNATEHGRQGQAGSADAASPSTDDGAARHEAVRLIGAVSHEMRNPLNGILGMAHLLADTTLDKAQRNYLEAIQSSADVLLTLVNDLLDLTALQSGAVPIKRTPCDIDQLVNQTLELAAPAAHAHGLALGSFVDPSIAYPLRVDAARVRQILTNLVSNAVKFTRSGGVRVDVRLSHKPAATHHDFEPLLAKPVTAKSPDADATLIIEVSDTGDGIEPGEQGLIFEPFGRSKSAHIMGTQGTGLGLPLSRGLATAMGGTLELAHSEPASGTCMRLAIPIEDCPIALSADVGPLDGLRVLIAMLADEDEQISIEAETLAASLRAAGATTRLVSDAAQLNGPPHNTDHVLIDHRFSHAVLWARLCLPGTGIRPVVLINAEERNELAELQRAGFGGYLMRPVRRASMIAMLTDRFQSDQDSGFRNDPADREPSSCVAISEAKSILLADDSPVNALLVKAALERAGHTVMTVDDGARAIALAHDQAGSPFDMILLDLSMPVLDGFAAARQIRAQGFTGRIIAISGNTDPEIDSKLAKAGFDGFAQKPVTPDELEKLVDG
ncbi:MAG: response regulator [Pseudomonadota bacterium]